MNQRTAKKLRKQSGDARPRTYKVQKNGKTVVADKERRKYQELKKDYYRKCS